MAVTQSRDNRTIVAGADLSAAQFTFVSLDANAKAIPTGAGLAGFGLLEVGTAAGGACTVTKTGKVMVSCGGTVTIGGNVSADANGSAVDSTAGDIILGVAYEAGVNKQVISIELSDAGNVAA